MKLQNRKLKNFLSAFLPSVFIIIFSLSVLFLLIHFLFDEQELMPREEIHMLATEQEALFEQAAKEMTTLFGKEDFVTVSTHKKDRSAAQGIKGLFYRTNGTDVGFYYLESGVLSHSTYGEPLTALSDTSWKYEDRDTYFYMEQISEHFFYYQREFF